MFEAPLAVMAAESVAAFVAPFPVSRDPTMISFSLSYARRSDFSE